MCKICENPYAKLNGFGICSNCNTLLRIAVKNFYDPIGILKYALNYLEDFENSPFDLVSNGGIAAIPVADVFPIAKAGKKICSSCGITYPATHKFFHRHSRRADGLDPQCKICRRLYFQEYHIRRKYGIDDKKFKMMIEVQDNKCAICREIFTSRPCIDHNHDTDEVRMLLCTCCNSIIGYAHENIEILRNAIDYLKKFQK